MNEVWVLEASQGSYSDRYDWIVNVYSSEEACYADTGNSKIPFVQDIDTKRLWAVVGPEDFEPVFYTLTKHEVYGMPRKN